MESLRARANISAENPVDNSASALWLSITNVGLLKNIYDPNIATNTSAVLGNSFVAKTPEVFAYDGDGNLTNDGVDAHVGCGESLDQMESQERSAVRFQKEA